MGYDVEIILMRQFASYLALPIFVVDPKGDLIYFNEPAEELLGVRYDETGEMPLDEWANGFVPTDDKGDVVPEQENPLVVALEHQRPAHSELWIQGRDGHRRHLSVTAFPLVGQHERYLGAAAIFWQNRVE